MTWIELHQEVRDHPKIKRLARQLGVHHCQAKGHIVDLWLWASMYAPDGKLGHLTEAEIADAGHWDGAPELFVKGLVECGLVDEKNRKRGCEKIIHDWSKHGLRLLKSHRERQRKHRLNKKLKESASVSPSRQRDVTVTPFLPNLTVPKEKDIPTPEKRRGKPKAAGEAGDDAVRIYDQYAEHIRAGARADALRSIRKLLKEYTPDELAAAVLRYAGNGMPAERRYRIQANNFFGEKARFQDYLPRDPGEAPSADAGSPPKNQPTATQLYFARGAGEASGEGQ